MEKARVQTYILLLRSAPMSILFLRRPPLLKNYCCCLLFLSLIIVIVPYFCSCYSTTTTAATTITMTTSDTITTTTNKATTTSATKMVEEPNPPVWPEGSVTIIRDTDDKEWVKQQLVNKAQDPYNDNHQTFTSDYHFHPSKRHAILFAPGTYPDLHFQVGYYTQVQGLGTTPDDVKFTCTTTGTTNGNSTCSSASGPYVPALNKHIHHPHGTVLDTFWRSAENFYVDNDMMWAVSQASPLRRVRVNGDLYLHDKSAYASGGHLANAAAKKVVLGGQQQYLIRNVDIGQGGVSGGAWSMVLVGCSGGTNIPKSSTGNATSPSITVVDKPRVRMEKPYIAMKDDGQRFELRIPRPLYDDDDDDDDTDQIMTGTMFNGSNERIVDFANVRVVVPSDDDDGDDNNPTFRIQQALDQGKDVVLSPGIYHLKQTIEMRRPNQVLLGLGLATLVAPSLSSGPCIHVESGVPGVIVAGIMLEANSEKKKSQSLLEWGEEDGPTSMSAGNKNNPGGLFDVFCRVGGATSGTRQDISVDTMMRIHTGPVVGDNLWLWRADHADLLSHDDEQVNYPHISPLYWQSEQDEYRVETGIEVNGDDVTIYGLAVEHANGHQTVWGGERGAVHFYQCEYPYCVDRKFQENEYRGYLVKESVQEHVVYAPGIYSNFRNDDVMVSTAIEHPERSSVKVINPFTVKLDNKGGVASIVNGKGPPAVEQGIPTRK